MNSNDLPIFEIERKLIHAIQSVGRVIVQAPTGSGKSTQIPQMLLDHGSLGAGQVVILQPRRLATRMLAARVAEERGVRLGDEVGYQVRFEDHSGAQTRIKFETEGILLRQMLTNPVLEGVSAIIFDEFHERHLYGDITLARALQIQKETRPDLKLLVISATLDLGPIEKYLSPCAVLTSAGRVFPVSVEYIATRSKRRSRGTAQEMEDPAWELAQREFERLVHEGAAGDFLIFMPGAFEISRTVQAIKNSPSARGFVVLPLHGELSAEEQDAAVARQNRRKAIVATNVAESSLTIEGVGVVIDSGLARIPRFDPYRGINTLFIERISRASADQRAGRAGRMAPGRCVRLWTERENAERASQEVPEIRRLDLSEAILMLMATGVNDVKAFCWMEPPEIRSLERAELLLRDLGALDRTGKVTELGRHMLSFPVHPRYARMLIAAGDYGCVRAVALIAALTQGRNILMRRQGSDVREGRDDLLGDETESDFFILTRAWRYAHEHRYDLDKCRQLGIHAQSAQQVRPLFEYFLTIARRVGLQVEDRAPYAEAIQKCVLMGFSDQLARRIDSSTLRCQLVHGRKGVLASESAVRKSPLFVAAEVREVEGRERELNVLLDLATAIREEWLKELFPDDFSEQIEVRYDPETKRVSAARKVLFRDIVLDIKRVDPPPAEEAAARLAEEVIKGNLTLKLWDHDVEQWICRVNSLGEWCPELNLPAIAEDERRRMIRQICLGETAYRNIKEKPVWSAVKSGLSGAQLAMVEKHAPARLVLPNGRQAKLTYVAAGVPFISLRIQELYDVKQTPKIAMGRVQVVVHILGPNHRPVQITKDLAGFWSEHYPRIKQEMKRKYPKHEWR